MRAARRLAGDRLFTQDTPAEQRKHQPGLGNESIGLGCYNFDSHTARRMACTAGTGECHAAPKGTPPNTSYVWNEVRISPCLQSFHELLPPSVAVWQMRRAM